MSFNEYANGFKFFNGHIKGNIFGVEFVAISVKLKLLIA